MWLITDAQKLKKKTGLTSRNWTDLSISVDKRQIRECQAGWQSVIPLPDLSKKIEGDSAHIFLPAKSRTWQSKTSISRIEDNRAIYTGENKMRTARTNGTKQAFASYFRRDLHKTRLILEQNFRLFLFCPRLK